MEEIHRVYVIKYNFYSSMSGKYGDVSGEERVEYFDKFERDKFIKRYQELNQEGVHFDNIKCFYANLHEILDMSKVIEAI